MQTVQQAIADVLNARERDLVDLYEIYDHFYEPGAGGFDPSQALLRLTSVSGVTWNNHSYRRQSVGRSDIDRSMGPTFNSVSFKLTNVDRFMAAFILTHDIEGMRLVVRTVSKGTPANSTASVVIFTGRLDKPGEIDKRTCPMSAKQDLASVQHVVPWREFEQSCPLVFKGPDCLGTETLAEKSAEYQAATTCDHARDGDCARFANTKFFQGFRFNPISGTFRYQTTETKRFLLFFTKKKTVWRDGQWSSEDLTPYGHKVSFALGRVQAPLVPIEIADHGDSLRFRGAIGEGPLDAITNVKNQSGGPSPTSLTTHLGEYGGEGTQTADPLFPNSDLYSRTANVTGLVGGGSFTAKDPMPDITVTARGMRAPLPDAGGVFNQTGWTDNPAYLTRYVLTDPRLFNISPNLIDDAVCFDTAKFCDEPLIDDSNGERLFVPAAQASEFGTGPEQARRFRSTGLLDSRWYRYHLGLAAELPEFIEPDIETFDPASPPDLIAPVRYLRRRYTVNTLLSDETKAVDFLFKVLLPAFRGYITIDASGKLQIRCERPVDNAFLRSDVDDGAESIAVDNVEAWRASLAGEVLIGAHLVTSEIRKVLSATYSLAGNAITLAAAASGTLTAAASGATLSGGTASAAASGYIDLGSRDDFAVLAGAQVSCTLDGIVVAYTLDSFDTLQTAAVLLATHLNADPTVRRYARASASGTRVTITSKLGWLNLDQPTSNAHGDSEEILRIAGHFDASSIRDGSFKWPLGGQQSTINQVVLSYRSAKDDFAPRELRVNDSDHQKRTGKTDKYEVNGSAIDNLHQAVRIAEAEFSKRREGDFFCSWTTGARSLIYDEGDLVAVTDASGGFINLPVRIEQLKISAARDVSIVARIYSTIMFSDDVGQHTIALPSVLPALTSAPPAVADFTLGIVPKFSPNREYVSLINGYVTFGQFLLPQLAKLYVKAPSDTDYQPTSIVLYPDTYGQAGFRYTATEGGTFYFKLVTMTSEGKTGSPATDTVRSIPAFNPFDLIDPPQELVASLEGNTVFLSWKEPASNPERVKEYQVSRSVDFSSLDYQGPDRHCTVKLSASQGGTTVRFYIRAIDYLGSTPTYTYIDVNIASVTQPSSYAVSFDGDGLRHIVGWPASAKEIVEIELSKLADFSLLVGHGLFTEFKESLTDFSSRALVRYARAKNAFNKPSSSVSASHTVSAPASPTVTKDAVRQNEVFLVLHVATTTPRSQVKWTVVQTRAPGGSFPVNTNANNNNQIRIPGAPEEIVLDFTAGGTIEYRVCHEDAFTPTQLDQQWSATGSHTFAKFQDIAIDPTTALSKLAAEAGAIMTGGGTVSVDGSGNVTWTAPFYIAPLPAGFSPTGQITINAASALSVNVGQIVVARYTKGSTSAATINTYDLSAYTPPDHTSAYFDRWIVWRRPDGKWKFYNGIVLDVNQKFDADTFIPYLSTLEAIIGTAKITKLNVLDVYAASIVANQADVNRIVFGQDMGSSNFVSHGAQTPQSEPVTWQSITGMVANADGSLTKTAPDSTGNSGASSSRSIHSGDGYAEFAVPDISLNYWFVVGLSYGGPAGSTNGINFGFYHTGGSMSVYENGVARTSSLALNTGDILRVAVESGVVKYYRKIVGTSVYNLIYTSGVTPRLPLLVDTSIIYNGHRIPPVTLHGLLAPTIGTKLRWINNVRCTLDTNDDVTGGSTSGTDYTGVFSIDSLAANQAGAVEWKYGFLGAGRNLGVGFSDSDPDQSLSSSGPIIYSQGTGVLLPFQGGVNPLGDGVSFTTVTTSDLIRFARDAAGICTVYKNGIIVYTFPAAYTGIAHVDVSFSNASANETLKQARLFKAGAIGQGVNISSTQPSEFNAGQKLKGVLVDDAARFAYLFDSYGKYIGNDYGHALLHKVTGIVLVDSVLTTDGSEKAWFQLDISTPFFTDNIANFDSVRRARVRVLNQFGEEARTFTFSGFAGDGIVGEGYYPARYAHPEFQAIFCISFWNGFGWSEEVFWQNGVKSLSMPAQAKRAQTPLELTGNPLELHPAGASANTEMHLAWRAATTNQGNQTVFYRRRGETVWSSFSTASTTATNASSAFVHLGYDTWAEVYVRNDSSGFTSNIALIKTGNHKPVQTTVRPVTAVTVRQSGATQATIEWAMPDLTGVFSYSVYRTDGTLIGTTANNSTYSMNDTALTVGQRYTYYVIANYSGSNSLTSQLASLIIQQVGAAVDPTSLAGTRISDTRIDWTWALNSATGSVYFDYKIVNYAAGDDPNSSSFWASGVTTLTLSAGTANRSLTGLSVNTYYAARVRVSDAGSSPSNVRVVSTAASVSREYS